ncbi:MAG: hypothetical protein IT340_21035 [Chloroflexi bacterium]|nr:hypothetical protein [Chloroflexota bacterium]
MKLDTTTLKFPVICFNDSTFRVIDTQLSLTLRPSSVLKSGWFDGMLIIDCEGIAYKIRKGTKLGRSAFSWHSLILDPIIEIDLEQEGAAYSVSLEEARNYVFASTTRWHGLEARADFDELSHQIGQAKSVADLIRLLAEHKAG